MGKCEELWFRRSGAAAFTVMALYESSYPLSLMLALRLPLPLPLPRLVLFLFSILWIRLHQSPNGCAETLPPRNSSHWMNDTWVVEDEQLCDGWMFSVCCVLCVMMDGMLWCVVDESRPCVCFWMFHSLISQ